VSEAAARTLDWEALVRPAIPGLAPYRPGAAASAAMSAPGALRLNWNESAFGPLPGVLDAVARALPAAWMYPHADYTGLRADIADWIGLTPAHIVPAHGIQALIAAVTALFVSSGDRVVVAHPSYGLYPQTCAAAGATVERVPLRELRLDLDEMARAARRVGARLVWVCDPNNPTGSWVGAGEWERFLDALPAGCVAVVDEAYIDFVAPERRLERARDVDTGRPVVLMRTFSKLFGLAGLRLGYAVAHPALAPFFDVVQEPFNVNRAALVAGRASLARADAVEGRRRETAAARELLAHRLAAAGIAAAPSEANFLLAHVGTDGEALARRLAARGVLVRPGADFGMERAVRITVAPEEAMERAAAAIAHARDELAA
jgi:histidinol-phosphate aminotransferase